jgi:hypothetical protein
MWAGVPGALSLPPRPLAPIHEQIQESDDDSKAKAGKTEFTKVVKLTIMYGRKLTIPKSVT